MIGWVCSVIGRLVVVVGIGKVGVGMVSGSRVGIEDLADNRGSAVVDMASSCLCSLEAVGNTVVGWMGL
jgi:hypothetical protein